MSNALRNVAETTAHAWSDLVDEARELVDDARDRIEDLPPLRARRRGNNKRWTLMAIVGALVLLMVVAKHRHQHHDGMVANESTSGGRMAEKSLAVS